MDCSDEWVRRVRIWICARLGGHCVLVKWVRLVYRSRKGWMTGVATDEGGERQGRDGEGGKWRKRKNKRARIVDDRTETREDKRRRRKEREKRRMMEWASLKDI